MLDLESYLIALAGAGTLTGLSWLLWRPTALGRCFSIVLGVWIVGYLYGDITGDYVHAPINVLTDAFAASLIMMRPAGRFQSALGATYVIQVVIHAAFLLRVALTGSADEVVYYETLTIWAFIQLGVIGVWNGRIWWGRRGRNRDKAGVSSSSRSVAGLGKAG